MWNENFDDLIKFYYLKEPYLNIKKKVLKINYNKIILIEFM